VTDVTSFKDHFSDRSAQYAQYRPHYPDALFRFLADIVGTLWPPERCHVDTRYANIDFPATRIDTPTFHMQVKWSAQDLLGYLRTWSACKRYRQERGEDAVSIIEPELTAAWGDAEREVSWHLTLWACRY